MQDDGILPEIREQAVRMVIGHQTWWIVHGNVTTHPTPLSLLHCNNISIACHLKLVRHPVLGGLHHEYELVPEAT